MQMDSFHLPRWWGLLYHGKIMRKISLAAGKAAGRKHISLTKFTGIVVLAVLLAGARLLPLTAAERDPRFTNWLIDLRAEAVLDGISVKTLNMALAGVELRAEVVKQDRSQPEFKLTLDDYLKRVVSPRRVAAGRQMLENHRELLADVAASYRVQPRFLVALWGIESDYGRVLGGVPAVQSLVTMAYDPRRSAYFRKELLQLLHVLEDGLAPLEDLQGSWAGAMGGLQFMPSAFRRYAVDYDGDGRVDIWRNNGDLFATGARYLAGSGWNDSLTWGREVSLLQGFDRGLIGRDNRMLLQDWQKQGVRRLNGQGLPERELVAYLVIPDRESGRVFLVYDNFEVLLEWNRSDLFAIAVGTLADRLGGGL